MQCLVITFVCISLGGVKYDHISCHSITPSEWTEKRKYFNLLEYTLIHFGNDVLDIFNFVRFWRGGVLPREALLA